MLLFISLAIDGDNESTASFIILGPRSSSPVALVKSNLMIYDFTCSVFIKGILNFICPGTLLSTN